MKARRAVIDVLDRPGGRWLLQRLATAYVRAHGAPSASVFYDNAWIRADGQGRFLVDSARFGYWALLLREFGANFDYDWVQAPGVWLWRYAPQAGETLVDVGAGVGVDALAFASLVGPAGRVVAVEAHPATFALLCKAVDLNRATVIEPVHCAILDRPGMVALQNKRCHTENRLVLEPTAESSVDVPGVTLDQLRRDASIERIDLLKVNIEGAERLVIQAMDETLGRTRHVAIACHDFIWRAIHDEWYRTRDLVCDYLTSNGFDVQTSSHWPEPSDRDVVYGRNLRL